MIQTMPNVKIIPAVVKPIEKTNKYKQLRVAAYCRVYKNTLCFLVT